MSKFHWIVLLFLTSTLETVAQDNVHSKQYGLRCSDKINGLTLDRLLLADAADTLQFLEWMKDSAVEYCYYCYDEPGVLNTQRVFDEYYYFIYAYKGVFNLRELEKLRKKNNSLNNSKSLTDWDLSYLGTARNIVVAEMIDYVFPVLYRPPGRHKLHYYSLLTFRVKDVIMTRDSPSLQAGDTIVKVDYKITPTSYNIEEGDTLLKFGNEVNLPKYDSKKDYLLFLGYPPYAHLVKSYNGYFEDEICLNFFMPLDMNKIYEYEQNIEKISVFKYLFSNN